MEKCGQKARATVPYMQIRSWPRGTTHIRAAVQTQTHKHKWRSNHCGKGGFKLRACKRVAERANSGHRQFVFTKSVAVSLV